MQKYRFPTTIYKTNENGVIEDTGKKNVIMYKCLICDCFMKEWDDSWDDAKKAEVKAEVDAHHNEHIVDETTDV